MKWYPLVLACTNECQQTNKNKSYLHRQPEFFYGNLPAGAKSNRVSYRTSPICSLIYNAMPASFRVISIQFGRSGSRYINRKTAMDFQFAAQHLRGSGTVHNGTFHGPLGNGILFRILRLQPEIIPQVRVEVSSPAAAVVAFSLVRRHLLSVKEDRPQCLGKHAHLRGTYHADGSRPVKTRQAVVMIIIEAGEARKVGLREKGNPAVHRRYP